MRRKVSKLQTDPELTQTLEPADKNIKSYYNYLHMFKKLSIDPKDLKKKQIESLEIKLSL